MEENHPHLLQSITAREEMKESHRHVSRDQSAAWNEPSITTSTGGTSGHHETHTANAELVVAAPSTSPQSSKTVASIVAVLVEDESTSYNEGYAAVEEIPTMHQDKDVFMTEYSKSTGARKVFPFPGGLPYDQAQSYWWRQRSEPTPQEIIPPVPTGRNTLKNKPTFPIRCRRIPKPSKEDHSPPLISISAWMDNHLLGRDTELRQLLERFNAFATSVTPSAKMCLIQGASGSGKTAIGRALGCYALEESQGIFLRGNFDDCREIFDVLSTALQDFAYQIEINPAKDYLKGTLLACFDKHEQSLLSDYAPSLHSVWKDTPPPRENEYQENGSMARIRGVGLLSNLFLRFAQAVASPKCPVILMFENVQLANDASMDVIAYLASELSACPIFFLLTMDAEHKKFKEGEESCQPLRNMHIEHRISLANLDENAVCELLTNILGLIGRQSYDDYRCHDRGSDDYDDDGIKMLSRELFAVSNGHMLFLKELLRKLEDDELVYYDRESSTCKFDMHLIRSTLPIDKITLDVLLRKRIEELATNAQKLIIAASFFGTRLDEKLLARLFPFHVDTAIGECTNRGLLVADDMSRSLQFAHSGVQQAARDLVDRGDLDSFKLALGRKLWKELDAEELDTHIFVVLDQLMVSIPLKEKERLIVASCCLRAGEKAVHISMFGKAAAFLQHGIDLLGCQGWKWNYQLTLKLHSAAAEVYHSLGRFDKSEQMVHDVLENARRFHDTLAIKNTSIHILGTKNRLTDAIDLGLETLRGLKQGLPSSPNILRVSFATWKLRTRLKERSQESLLRLPQMTDTEKLAAMQIMSTLLFPVLFARPRLFPLLVVNMVELTLSHGLCGASSVGLAGWGAVLCRGGGYVEEAYRYGCIAMNISETFNSQAWVPRVSAVFYGLICTWKVHYRHLLQPIKQAYRTGLLTGDIEFATLNLALHHWMLSLCSRLPDLVQDLTSMIETVNHWGQFCVRDIIEPLSRFSAEMMAPSSFDTAHPLLDSLNSVEGEVNAGLSIMIKFNALLKAYILCDYPTAEKLAPGLDQVFRSCTTSLEASEALMYQTLTWLARCRPRNLWILQKARTRVKVLRNWAVQCPENILGKLFLLEAELARCEGKKLLATSKYLSSILHSREEGIILQEALANELLGRHQLSNGESHGGFFRLKEAHRLYEHWGSLAKLDQLVQEFGNFFSDTIE